MAHPPKKATRKSNQKIYFFIVSDFLRLTKLVPVFPDQKSNLTLLNSDADFLDQLNLDSNKVDSKLYFSVISIRGGIACPSFNIHQRQRTKIKVMLKTKDKFRYAMK